jgi:hypothetical protein
MTPEAQRIAIAEACGWHRRLATHDKPVERCGMKLPNSFGHPIEAWWHETNERHRGVYAIPPDFLNDLNAMHEAEKTLTREQWTTYYDIIEGLNAEAGNIYQKELHATAAQRAEAFLRTLNLWTDAP